MADSLAPVHLPEPVDELLQTICHEQSQPQPDALTKRKLASLDQAEALRILGQVRNSVIRKTLNHFIVFLVNKTLSAAMDASPTSNQPQGQIIINQLPQSPLPAAIEASPPSNQPQGRSIINQLPQSPLPAAIEASPPSNQPQGRSIINHLPQAPLAAANDASPPSNQPQGQSIINHLPQAPLAAANDASPPSNQLQGRRIIIQFPQSPLLAAAEASQPSNQLQGRRIIEFPQSPLPAAVDASPPSNYASPPSNPPSGRRIVNQLPLSPLPTTVDASPPSNMPQGRMIINQLSKSPLRAVVDASPPSNALQGPRIINQFSQSPLPPRVPGPSGPQGSTPNQRKRQSPCFSGNTRSPSKQTRMLDFYVDNEITNPALGDQIGSSSANLRLDNSPSPLLEALDKLEFRKAFLLLSYIGRNKLENITSVDEIQSLYEFASPRMGEFESHLWFKFGQRYCDKNDRIKHLDWHPQRTGSYHCHVYSDGSYRFKGPLLSTAATLLHKVVGYENVLTVKFLDEDTTNPSFATFSKLIEDGIFVGSKRYRFFVCKDGGKEGKKKNPSSSPVKCYFICTNSLARFYDGDLRSFGENTMHDLRCIFMSVHNVSSLSNYMARFSLILSKTVTLDFNMDDVCVEIIDDVLCQSEDGNVVKDKDGKPLIHTDGTGFISEDLALKCPQNFYRGSSAVCQELEGLLIENCPELCRLKSQFSEPPLLIQFRMFHCGLAVKGTVLINRQLQPNTIQVRPSMIKVTQDLGPSSSATENAIQVAPSMIKGKKESGLSGFKTVNSFEIVGTSNKPKKPRLSKNLIALLCYGGVPKEFFMDLLKGALLETQGVLSNKRAALRAAVIHGERDNFTAARLILSGIPLEEPYVQYRLSSLANEEKKKLKEARLPIAHSFYLMGTADPTGTLRGGEVCVILENGQIFGKVLVYRNPGTHFGDIHVVNAVLIKDLGNIIGNSKYGIFFPARGPRSLADEIAGGDYDGDMYWVSQNPQLLESFKPSEPWTCIYPSPTLPSKKPKDIPPEKLEQELFGLFLAARFKPSKAIGIAADSWMVYMDRILTLQDECVEEKNGVKRKMLELIDIYYDALDAPKKGKKVEVPDRLIPKKFPHHMERVEFTTFKSASILGLIYDEVMNRCREQQRSIEIWKLSCFEIEVPEACIEFWEACYKDYRKEMSLALRPDEDSKSDSADQVYKKYQKLLYDADDLDKSEKAWEEIKAEARAIYRVAYDYAIKVADAGKCGFAWRVAGQALIKMFMDEQGEIPICCAASVLRELF